MIDVSSQFNFIGCFEDTPQEANKGDICLVGACEYVYDGSCWQPFGYGHDNDYKEEPKHIMPMICTQCGATLHAPYKKCEFCGTEFRS